MKPSADGLERDGGFPHPRQAVARCRSGPQGIDNLREALGRGIIRDGFAATIRTMDGPPGGPADWIADGHVTCCVQCLRRRMRSAHGGCPVRRPAPGSTMVASRLAPRVQAVRHGWFGEYHT
jgi:hypothetical protein